ncbi:MAG: T9SS type A sorting domain-containing protein [Flavobacteriales bacterium]|nr:T9SS type A sorting domain-containing protein [Flavobacteriales bacterium]
MKNTFLTFAALAISAASFGQTVTSFAGKDNVDPTNNYTNSNSTLSETYFYKPEGICWDGNGNMYVTESNKIRLIIGDNIYNRSGRLGDISFSQNYSNGASTAAGYYAPASAVCDASGNVMIVDAENHAVRKLTAFVNIGNQQTASTFAGALPQGGAAGYGTPGYKDATGTNALLNSPKGIAMDANGNMYVTDFLNDCIRKITPAGVVTTLAGQSGSTGSADGSGANARFNSPYGITMFDATTLIVTDYGNSAVRKVNISTGNTTTICGGLGYKDGTLANARFKSPRGVAVVDGLIYVADGTTIRVIDQANGTVSTFAGSGTAAGNSDGVGSAARFTQLYGLAYDGKNGLYVTDHGSHQIKKVTIDNLAPDADFSVSKTDIEINQETTLTDISGGKPATKRKWTVTALDGTTSNVVIVQGDVNADKAITVKFSATGVYKVTLEVTNEYGSDVVTKSNINVSTVGIAEVLASENVTIYPNPVLDNQNLTVRVENRDMVNAQIALFDCQGKVVYQTDDISGSEAQISLPKLSAGMYVLLVSDNGFVASKRLVIE